MDSRIPSSIRLKGSKDIIGKVQLQDALPNCIAPVTTNAPFVAKGNGLLGVRQHIQPSPHRRSRRSRFAFSWLPLPAFLAQNSSASNSTRPPPSSLAPIAAAGLGNRAEIILSDYRTIHLPAAGGKTLFIGNPPHVRHHQLDSKGEGAAHGWSQKTRPHPRASLPDSICISSSPRD